mmetsp:Transcript_40042/g.85486  ORF Transcript_40042/g.85486 Transcript_40042/m.85486 type:complete len:222 (-) Transcript_40042:79-744(-)
MLFMPMSAETTDAAGLLNELRWHSKQSYFEFQPITLYHRPCIEAGVAAIRGLGGCGASEGESAPGSMIAILMQPSSSMVHCSMLSSTLLPYCAKHPTAHSASPMHLAVHASPFMQSGSSAHAWVCSLQFSAKHSGRTSSEWKRSPARLTSSFSASAGTLQERKTSELASIAVPTARSGCSLAGVHCASALRSPSAGTTVRNEACTCPEQPPIPAAPPAVGA